MLEAREERDETGSRRPSDGGGRVDDFRRVRVRLGGPRDERLLPLLAWGWKGGRSLREEDRLGREPVFGMMDKGRKGVRRERGEALDNRGGQMTKCDAPLTTHKH